MRLIFDIAVTHISGRGRQTLVAILGVAIGVGFSIAMAALMEGGQDDFMAELIDTMAHVEITDERPGGERQPAEEVFAAAAIHGLKPPEDTRGIINPTAVLARLKAWVPGRMSESLRTEGVMRYAGRDAGASIIGVDPQAEQAISPITDDFVRGGFSALASGGNNVVIGDRMAKKLGADFGDTITAVSSSGLSRQFKIVGIFHTGTRARDEAEAYMLLKNTQILSGRPNAINDIRIKLDNPYAAPLVAQRAEDELGYRAISWQEANEGIMEAFMVRNVIMYTVVAAIMLVAGFGIFNIVSTITHEKARDIAIMKSLGFSRTDVQRIFVLEGVAIGAAGSLLGFALGFALTYALGSIRFELAAAGRDITNLPVAWDALHYAIASAFALASAAVAGYLPAQRAARVNPVDIIRGAT